MIIVLYLVLSFVVSTNCMQQMCCRSSSSPFEKAIINSDFSKVKKLLDNPETFPLISYHRHQNLAKGITQRRLKYIDQRFADLRTGSSNKKISFAAVLLSFGLFNLFNANEDLKRDISLGFMSVGTSLTSLYYGGKLALDAMFGWTENDNYAKALAIEKLLADRNLILEESPIEIMEL